nr:molybdenum cofactor guanylyltransferase [Pelagicoccus albus]
MLGVVLSGGKSLRMGFDKGRMEVLPGVPQLIRQLDILDAVCAQRGVCRGKAPLPADMRLPSGVWDIEDSPGIAGPMSGVIAALRVAEDSPVLVIACDMPYLNVSHLVQLVNRRNPEAACTSFLASDGLPDPMCCIYEQSCLPEMERLASEGKASLRKFLLEANTERIEVAEGMFLASVNRPTELEAARARLRFTGPDM